MKPSRSTAAKAARAKKLMRATSRGGAAGRRVNSGFCVCVCVSVIACPQYATKTHTRAASFPTKYLWNNNHRSSWWR